ACQKQPAVLHGLDDKTAHRRNALLQHRAFLQLARATETLVQFIPDALVGPVLDFLVMIALQVETGQRRRPHGVERKTAIGIGIDQLMIGRRTFRQDPEPSEWIVPLEHAEDLVGNAGPADPMKAVTPRNEVAADFLLPTLVPEPDLWLLAGQLMDADVAHLKQQWTAICQTAFDEILDHLLLSVNRHTLVHERLEIDTVQVAVDADIDPPMQHSFTLHPCANAQVGEKVRCPVLDQARPNSISDVVAAAVLDD